MSSSSYLNSHGYQYIIINEITKYIMSYLALPQKNYILEVDAIRNGLLDRPVQCFFTFVLFLAFLIVRKEWFTIMFVIFVLAVVVYRDYVKFTDNLKDVFRILVISMLNNVYTPLKTYSSQVKTQLHHPYSTKVMLDSLIVLCKNVQCTLVRF